MAHATEDDLTEHKQWADRLTAAAKRHDADQEVMCVTTIGRHWPWALNTLPSALIEQAARESEVAHIGQPRIDMLQVLYDSRWQHGDGSRTSWWWLTLSLNLLEHNRPEEAIAVAAQITDPYALVGIQVDNRYRRIGKSEMVEGDIVKAAKRELERHQKLAAERPRELGEVLYVALGLLVLQRYADVLSLTDTALQRAAQATAESSPYDDLQQNLPWILDVRSKAYSALGRYDESLAAMRRARDEAKRDSVSHALNLAILLAMLDRPQEAAAALPPLESASAYGRAIAAQAHVMIASELDDASGVEAALNDLQANAYPSVRSYALIVAGRDEEAAKVLFSRLVDPDLRTEALVDIQDYADYPAPPREVAWRERGKALRNRPEIRQEIVKYGRVRRYALRPY